MNSFLIMEDADTNFVIESVQQQQIIFHPTIAPAGHIDYTKFFASKRKKPFILALDRNILSSLLKFCEKGSLKNSTEVRLIGLIMTWAEMNGVAISAGMAVRERASQMHSQEVGLVELQRFKEAFDAYPGQVWLRISEGQLIEVPPVQFSMKPAQNITVNYADSGDHYDMAVASLLHAVRLYRNETMKPADKVLDFFKWMCDHLLISEYLLVYAIMLFTEQENIKAPKHAKNNDMTKIIAGCENQAWDIAYLTNWSTLYSNTDEYAEKVLFATNDVLLKRIFINTNGPHGVNGLIFEVFSKKEYNQIIDEIGMIMTERVKPDFGDNPHEYFEMLIEEEKRLLSASLQNCD